MYLTTRLKLTVSTKLTAEAERKIRGLKLIEYGNNEESLLPEIKIELIFTNLFFGGSINSRPATWQNRSRLSLLKP